MSLALRSTIRQIKRAIRQNTFTSNDLNKDKRANQKAISNFESLWSADKRSATDGATAQHKTNLANLNSQLAAATDETQKATIREQIRTEETSYNSTLTQLNSQYDYTNDVNYRQLKEMDEYYEEETNKLKEEKEMLQEWLESAKEDLKTWKELRKN